MMPPPMVGCPPEKLTGEELALYKKNALRKARKMKPEMDVAENGKWQIWRRQWCVFARIDYVGR